MEFTKDTGRLSQKEKWAKGHWDRNCRQSGDYSLFGLQRKKKKKMKGK